MKKTLILASFLALAPFAKGQLLLEALEGGTSSIKCLERVKDKHYGDGVHNYIYCAVQGPNGKKWLNLNLGAEYAKESSPHFNPEALPTDFNDWKAFGNLYQWGRGSDGHEQVEYRQGEEKWEFRPINGVRTTQVGAGEQSNQMVTTPLYNVYANHLGESWVNDPCPNGYHIATAEDIKGLGVLDVIEGGVGTPSLGGSSKYPNLLIMTGVTIQPLQQQLTNGWNTSVTAIRVAGEGTSTIWLKGKTVGLRYNNNQWEIEPSLSKHGEGYISTLDRGFYPVDDKGAVLGEYDWGIIGSKAKSRSCIPMPFDSQICIDESVTVNSIRCVQD